MPAGPDTIAQFFAKTAIPLALADAAADDAPLMLVNEAFSRLTEYQQDEIVGRNCRFLQGEGTEELALRETREGLAEGRDCQTVLTNYTKSGRRFENLLFLFTLHDRQGNATFFMGSHLEVSKTISAAALDGHAEMLAYGVGDLANETQLIQIKTRQLLASSAVSLVRAKLMAPRY